MSQLEDSYIVIWLIDFSLSNLININGEEETDKFVTKEAYTIEERKNV